MGDLRMTRSPVYVKLSEKRVAQIEGLVQSWNFETRLFVLRRMRQYTPSHSWYERLRCWLWRNLWPMDRSFQILQDPELLSDWRRRFEVSGSQNASAAWNKVLHRELDWHDYQYLTALLERETNDIFVPPAFIELFNKIYRAHLLKEYEEDPSVPRAPLLLVVGGSGSGKSATVKQALEEAVFGTEVRPIIDLEVSRDEVLANQPFWRSLEDVDPELAVRIERRRKAEQIRLISRIPIVRYIFRERLSQVLSNLQEEGVLVDYAMVTPNDYQTAWAGEPGNYLRKAMGDPGKPAIRHLEEGHSAFGRLDQKSPVQSQQATLVDAANIIIDEIIFGRRDCVLITTTDQPEQFDPAIFRRFVERGLVVDIDDQWKEPSNLIEVVRMELRRNNYVFPEAENGRPTLSEQDLVETVTRLGNLFRERSLRITPAYVRRLISSVIGMKGDFRPVYLDDQFLVRDALKAVARNVHGTLYKTVVGHMDRHVAWDDYIGAIKNEFSEMANNALYYNVSEEKGVVLTGPPGSGKTFMVQAWLGDNREVQDLAVSLNDLADPVNPVEGMVENLERVYDIAKMLSPAMIFLDEGDSIAPRRSSQGGSPYDKVTNKFLSIIDGESPLNRVFTVLTTNRLDILDPALIRSKRLKVLNVTGHLRDEDALRIIRKELADLPLSDEVSYDEMVKVARSLCETPADFTAFAETVRSLRATEAEVLGQLMAQLAGTAKERARFVRFNYKTLVGLLEATVDDVVLIHKAHQGDAALLECLDQAAQQLQLAHRSGVYPITRWHLQSARQQLASSPTRKGKQQLDEFLETELSREPQIGFVVGVGANDTSGVLLPIATTLVYRMFPEKIIVTGAVSSSAPGAAELDVAVQMTHQSAREALTLDETYLQSLLPEMNMSRLLGEFLDGYSLHHQLLSASYNVGGPSAGFALAINTLSIILNLQVQNDFGITGAPWIKGARKGEIGASVIISGHRKKTEKVLQYLQRMYMPVQNYLDMEPEVLEAYRAIGKDVVGVSSFSSLVPEVFYISDFHQQQLQTFFQQRLEIALSPATSESLPRLKEENKMKAKELRHTTEEHIRLRLQAIGKHMQNSEAGFESLNEIFLAANISL
jgi:SpoVK/Ycf46/Vps4 family AAA+-type ATPase